MEYYLDDSEESDDEICFDEVTFKQFLKIVHCNPAANTNGELSPKVDYSKSVDADNAGSNFDNPVADIRIIEPVSKLSLCTETVAVDCNKVEMDEIFFTTDSQEEKLCTSPANSKYNENLSNTSQCTKYTEPKYKDDTHYKNIELNLTEKTESCNTTTFHSTPNKKTKNIDINFNTPLMKSKSKISDIQTLSNLTSLNTTADFDITEEQIEKCDSPYNSESSNELNDTLELIECIFNNKHNDHDNEHTLEKDLNLPLTIEPFSESELHPIPSLNIKKCYPTFEATSLGWQLLHTDNSVRLVDKQGKKICDSQGNADSIEIDEMLESVEHILTKSGTCISVYTYSLFNLNMKNCDYNFATNLVSNKPRASNYKTLMSISLKKLSPLTPLKTETKRNTYHYTSSSLAAYVKNVTREASLEEVCSQPLPNLYI